MGGRLGWHASIGQTLPCDKRHIGDTDKISGEPYHTIWCGDQTYVLCRIRNTNAIVASLLPAASRSR